MFTFSAVVAVSLMLIGLESLYRQDYSLGFTALVAIPVILVAQAGLYHVFHNSTTVIGAALTLTMCNAAFRVANSVLILKEPLDPIYVTLSVVFMVLASLALKQA